MKFVFVDTETTGLWPSKHGLWQIAGAVCDEALTIREQFNLQLCPKGVEIDPKALAASGMSVEELRGLGSDDKQYNIFINMLERNVDKFDKKDKMFFVAYNAQFDSDHVRAWLRRHGNNFYGSYFWHPPIDVMGLAALALVRERAELPDFKLGTVATYLGLMKGDEKLHDADVDIAITMQVFKEAVKRLRSGPQRKEAVEEVAE